MVADEREIKGSLVGYDRDPDIMAIVVTDMAGKVLATHGSPPEAVAPARLSPPAPTLRLPPQFTRFFGREEEIARLQTLLSDPEIRLVTLTGPGGSGKTRLALQTAQRLRDTSPVPAWFVPLVDLKGAGLIADKMLDALRLPRSPNSEPLEQVIAGPPEAASLS